jgi:hypothetical protein
MNAILTEKQNFSWRAQMACRFVAVGQKAQQEIKSRWHWAYAHGYIMPSLRD